MADNYCVYGISTTDGLIYIGFTGNLERRKSQHLQCRNQSNLALNEAISKHKQSIKFTVLGIGEKSEMLALERSLVSRNKSTLLNIMHGGEQSWRKSQPKPWVFGSGVRAPSSILKKYLLSQCHSSDRADGIRQRVAEFSDWIGGLGTKERCLAESNLFKYIMDEVPQKQAEAKRWVDLCGQAVIREMEAA